jgi:tetratricopeptide (TPR) repeat protein
MILRRIFLLSLCCFLITCKSRETPPVQTEEVIIYDTQETKETETVQEVLQESGGSSAQVSYQVQGPLPSLAGIGGRVNVQELNPVNYVNPDLDILKQMGADQYLIFFLAGEQFYKAGDYTKALAEFTSSINSNGEFVEALISRGNTRLKRGEYRPAIDDFTRAIRLESGWAELYNYRGFAKSSLAANSPGELNSAIEDFTRAIALNPNYADALINRSHAYYQRRDFDRVIEDCTRILRLEPQNAFIWNRRGSAWYHKENDDMAIGDFTEARRLRNDFTIAWFNRANAWFNKGELDRALADINRTLELNPSFAQAQILATRLSDLSLP